MLNETGSASPNMFCNIDPFLSIWGSLHVVGICTEPCLLVHPEAAGWSCSRTVASLLYKPAAPLLTSPPAFNELCLCGTSEEPERAAASRREAAVQKLRGASPSSVCRRSVKTSSKILQVSGEMVWSYDLRLYERGPASVSFMTATFCPQFNAFLIFNEQR